MENNEIETDRKDNGILKYIMIITKIIIILCIIFITYVFLNRQIVENNGSRNELDKLLIRNSTSVNIIKSNIITYMYRRSKY